MFKKSIIALFAIMLTVSFVSFSPVAKAQGCSEEGADSAFAYSRCLRRSNGASAEEIRTCSTIS